jgi:hypothetical protein
MAKITPQSAAHGGTAPTFTGADAGGDYVQLSDRQDYHGLAIHVLNGSGSGVTVTIKRQRQGNQGVSADRTVSVAATKERIISIRHDEVDDAKRVYLDYSAVTTVTVAALVHAVR